MSFGGKQQDIYERLSAARAHLILDYPFLGVLVLRLDWQEANWCRTTATDAEKFYYNSEYIDRLSDEEVRFVFAHESLHCALGHFARHGHRIERRWDIACDYAVNGILVKEGLPHPREILFAKMFDDMSAEEIYTCLDTLTDAPLLDEHIWDNGDPDSDKPPPLSPQSRFELELRWQERLASAARYAKQAGRFSATMGRLINASIRPRLPWRQLLAHHLHLTARDNYDYSRPNNRRDGSAIFPSLRSHQSDVAAAVDVSGSIHDCEMQEFLSEISAIKSFIRARITLLACDNRLADGAPWIYAPWEEVTLPAAVRGGGGTSFKPVFDWVETRDVLPDVLIYLTDAQAKFPPRSPPYPVLWLVKGKAEAPWGQRIRLN